MTHPVYKGTNKPDLTIPIWVVVVTTPDGDKYIDYSTLSMRVYTWPNHKNGKRWARDHAFSLTKGRVTAEAKLAKIEVL